MQSPFTGPTSKQRASSGLVVTLSIYQVLLLCGLVATALIGALGRTPRCAAPVAAAPLAAAPLAAPLWTRHRVGVSTPHGAMANEQVPALHRPVALLVGDSLTERSLDPDGGWGAAVAHHFARKLDVVNRGFSGYNSRWALPVLEQILDQLKASGQSIAFATLWLGANDSAMPDRSAARQHVPLSDYAANLEAMVTKMRASGIARVVLMTPPPIYEPARIKHQQERMGTSEPVLPDRTHAFTGAYAEAARAVGAKVGAPVLDLYTLLQGEEGWETGLLCDGLHFTAAGQAVVARMLIDKLAEAYPEISAETLTNHFPWWDMFAEAGPTSEPAMFKRFLANNSRETV